MIRGEDFIDALGMPDEGFNGAVDAALRQVKEREARPVMKRKMTLTLAAAVLAVVMLAGAALAAGLNLFEYFGKFDERLHTIAPETAVEDAPTAEIVTDALGTTRAKIDSAYYDGQSLIVAYTVENYRGYKTFAPTETELAEMTEDADFLAEARETGADQKESVKAFQAAVERKQPFGIVEYEIAVGGRCATDDGVELTPADVDVESAEDGPLYSLFECETPLPEAVRDRDSLNLVLPVELYTSWHWFDGEKIFERHAKETLAALTATVSRADGDGKAN